jgi:hypothetical protein
MRKPLIFHTCLLITPVIYLVSQSGYGIEKNWDRSSGFVITELSPEKQDV